MSSALPMEAMEQPVHAVYGGSPEKSETAPRYTLSAVDYTASVDYHDSDGSPCPRCSGTDYIDVASRGGEWMCLPCHNVVESGESQDLIDADRRMRLRAYQSARLSEILRFEIALNCPNTVVLRATLDALYATVSQIGRPSKEMLNLWSRAGVDAKGFMHTVGTAVELCRRTMASL